MKYLAWFDNPEITTEWNNKQQQYWLICHLTNQTCAKFWLSKPFARSNFCRNVCTRSRRGRHKKSAWNRKKVKQKLEFNQTNLNWVCLQAKVCSSRAEARKKARAGGWAKVFFCIFKQRKLLLFIKIRSLTIDNWVEKIGFKLRSLTSN